MVANMENPASFVEDVANVFTAPASTVLEPDHDYVVAVNWAVSASSNWITVWEVAALAEDDDSRKPCTATRSP